MMSAADFRMRHLMRVVLVAAVMIGVSACGGGGGGGSGGSTASVTISGKITFDRVPFKATLGTGLNFDSTIVPSPAREVVVEAVREGNVLGGEVVLTSTTTNAAGDYSLSVPANTTIFIRAKAQMLKTGAAPTWNFRVLNNTRSDALYVLDGTPASSGSSSQTRDLHASTGWGTTSYMDTRAAAPFAILDTMYQVKALVLSAKADTAFPALDLFWSVNNRNSSTFCPDDGNVVSSLYITFSQSNPNDECSTPTAGRDGIYVLGSFIGGDTDEFDQHVIAHEAGHYFEDRFSRSDSIGGEHFLSDKLDLRVAFGEGWGNAFGAMVLNDPVYRDSSLGANQDSAINFESVQFGPNGWTPGWYSEVSASKLLWDFFDGANESNDAVTLGFTPIYSAMTIAQPSTDSLTGIFSFIRALKVSSAAAANGIDALLAEHNITSIVDDYGSTELTNTGDSDDALPIYTDIQVNAGARQVCTDAELGIHNKLGNRRFLRFSLAQQGSVSISVSVVPDAGTRVADPDLEVFRRGQLVAFANDTGATDSVTQPSLAAGNYVIEAYECSHAFSNDYCLDPSRTDPPRGRTCMNVSVTSQ